MKSFGKILGTILTSPKFIEYISKSDLTELFNQALMVPGFRDRLKDSLINLGLDLRERYEIKSWDWYTDSETNKLVIKLSIDSEDMQKDFIEHFYRFLNDLRTKFGKGFDNFLKIYKISNIKCYKNELDNTVSIEVVTPKAKNFESLLTKVLDICKLDISFEEGEGM
ncbi:MAG: hypothetical protein N2V75_03935 [Methanophagales archaeon]|nr:hypothetical protein [Methanophagales archaeon]